MMPEIARRAGIAAFLAMEVMKEANRAAERGGSILHLEVGQPSTGAPQAVIAAARKALGTERLGYTDALGHDRLREAIAGHYRHYYGVAVPPERIIVTTGSSGAFLLSFLAAFDAGARVAVTEPGYPAYRNILRALDIEPVALAAHAELGFRPSLALIEQALPLDGLLLASPGNPTGTMLDEAMVAALGAQAARCGHWLILDEIYHGITYGGRAKTALALNNQAVRDRLIVVNSFSKYFCMTGWRLGWLVVPPALVAPIERLAQNLFISPPALSQLAGIAAFTAYDELDRNVVRYARNRDLLLNELPAAGFDRLAPADGAFYLYADVARWTSDSQAFCRRMLAQTGVATTPGVDFDPAAGQHYLRLSFAGETADMAQAVERLKSWKK